MSDKDIKREFLKQEIVPWDESYLYHGTPPTGLACILKNGLYCAGSHDLDFCLLSTSNNDNVLTLFSEVHGTTGLVFNPKFKKVLVLDDFWFDALYGMSGSGAADMWDDRVAENPEDDERAQKMGLWDGSEFKYESGRFLETFLPKDVEAIMFPSFREDKGGNAESEMAVTTAGMKVLEKAIEYIYIEGKEFDSVDAARKHLEEQGIECVEGENPPQRQYYISSGMKNGFYTLRVKFDEPTYYKSEFGVVSTGIIAKDHYVMTLTKDPETAAEKANAHLKEIGQTLSRPDFNLTGYLRGVAVDWMIFHGGKYEGHDVEYVIKTDPEYAIWAAENLSGNRYDGTVAILQEVLAPQLA